MRYSTIAQVVASHPRYFGATRPTSTGKQGHSPVLTSMSKWTSTTAGGRTITLHGRYLYTASRVFLGSTGTYSFHVKSSHTVTVTVPSHRAGVTAVAIDNAWGQSPATRRARMTYYAPPSLTSASPSTGSTTGGTRVTLTGSGFAAGVKVYFGSTRAASVKVLSGTALSVVTPRSSAGRVPVTVVTAYGSGTRAVFTYLAPTPAPSSTEPSAGRSPSPAPVTNPPSSTHVTTSTSTSSSSHSSSVGLPIPARAVDR